MKRYGVLFSDTLFDDRHADIQIVKHSCNTLEHGLSVWTSLEVQEFDCHKVSLIDPSSAGVATEKGTL